jgi:hypothetical protein
MKGNRVSSSFFVAMSILLSISFCGCGGGGGGSGSPAPVALTADSLVAEWNEAAMSLGPTIGTHMAGRILAMMHTAMYDAVIAFEGGYSFYHVSDLPPEGASQRAAAATAAYHILYTMYTPGDQRATIQALYDEHLARIEDGQGKNDGVDFGQSVAQAIMMLRSFDGAMEAMHVSHPDGTEPGEWQRTASGEPMAPGWGEVTPWAMTRGDQFDQGGPPPLNGLEYVDAYNEVMELGGKTSLTRTTEEAHLAMFWNPHVPAKWNSLARDIAQREQLSLIDSARLFALLSVTLADTAISGWNMKYKYSFWRPITAILLGDQDTNDLTDGDLLWEPYLVTPPFPEYVSGHSLTCAAVATVLALYLGTDDYTFEFRTMGIPEPRTYVSFWQAAEEAGQSRIYGGIHFQFANEDGLAAGTALGNYVFDNFFVPN